MTDPAQRHARSFGSVAASYDLYRPGYAAEAVIWALGERPLRVADVGAGTGILSRLLRRLGHEVIAVEPDDLMRARLEEVSPDITALAGTAEEIPLPTGSVDAVVAGQAYHWFDKARAHVEIARVLRPGGVFAALWNDADLRAQWTVRFVHIIDGVDAVPGVRPISDFGELFGPVTQAEFRHDVWLTPDDLVALATTRSPFLVATPQAQQELVDAVRHLTTGAELAGHERFAMPHVTRVHRATAESQPHGLTFTVWDAEIGLAPGPTGRIQDADSGRTIAITAHRGAITPGTQTGVIVSSWDDAEVRQDPRWPLRHALFSFAEAMSKQAGEPIGVSLRRLEALARDDLNHNTELVIGGRNVDAMRIDLQDGPPWWVVASTESPFVSVAGWGMEDVPTLQQLKRSVVASGAQHA